MAAEDVPAFTPKSTRAPAADPAPVIVKFCEQWAEEKDHAFPSPWFAAAKALHGWVTYSDDSSRATRISESDYDAAISAAQNAEAR